MILGLCESPITFNAIIEWSTALNDGEMQLREILDLDAMLSKDPAPESLEEGAADDDEISEKTAGPTYKEEEDIVEEAEEDEEDSMTERRTQRANEDDDDEDNTHSLAAMEESLKPGEIGRTQGRTPATKRQ